MINKWTALTEQEIDELVQNAVCLYGATWS